MNKRLSESLGLPLPVTVVIGCVGVIGFVAMMGTGLYSGLTTSWPSKKPGQAHL